MKQNKPESTRRNFLRATSCGFGSLALSAMLQQQAAAEQDGQARKASPLAVRQPHFTARAKRIIFLFMSGGPSQMDLYDYKPALVKGSGKPIPKRLSVLIIQNSWARFADSNTRATAAST